jgi:O-antigen/teichoic acid export membrane protein
MGFGLMFQATVVLQIAREQGVNVAIAAIAGIATLGVWNLAWRILQIPNLLFLAVARVAYPAMSRLLGTGEDPRAVIERGLAATAAVTGIVIVGLVGFATALPVLIGDSWGDVPTVLLWTGVALIVSAPLTVSTAGYLYAAGAPGAVAMATALSSVMWLGVGIPLLPSLGAPAMGIGWAAAAMVSTAVLWRATAARVRPAIAASVTAPTAVALVATGAGWLVAQRASDNLIGGILGLAVGEALVLVGLAILSRPALRDSRSLIAQGLDSLRVRRA